MKKKYLKTILFLAIMISVVYVFNLFQPKEFSSLIDTSEQTVTKIYIFNGRTGQSFNITDREQIQEFFRIISKPIFRLRKDQWNITIGYAYYVDIYQGNKKLARVMFKGTTVIIDNLSYRIDLDINKEVENYWLNIHKEV